MIHELIGKLSARGESFKDNKVTASQLGQLIDLVEDGVITRTSGKHLLRHLLENPTQTTALQVAQDLRLTAFSHSPIQNASADCQKHDVLLQLCAQAIVHLPAEVESFRRGNANVLNRIVGHVMKASRGRADAKAAGVVIARMINEPKQ